TFHCSFPPHVSAPFEDHPNALGLWRLDNFHRIRRRKHAGTTRRQALSLGVIFHPIGLIVIVECCGPRLGRDPGFCGGSSNLRNRIDVVAAIPATAATPTCSTA